LFSGVARSRTWQQPVMMTCSWRAAGEKREMRKQMIKSASFMRKPSLRGAVHG
jgi:hypothetical protein